DRLFSIHLELVWRLVSRITLSDRMFFSAYSNISPTSPCECSQSTYAVTLSSTLCSGLQPRFCNFEISLVCSVQGPHTRKSLPRSDRTPGPNTVSRRQH